MKSCFNDTLGDNNQVIMTGVVFFQTLFVYIFANIVFTSPIPKTTT